MSTLDEQIQQSISDWTKQEKDEERASRSGLYKFLSYVPLIGTSFDLADTFRDPTLENASQFGISLASDLIGTKLLGSLLGKTITARTLGKPLVKRIGKVRSSVLRNTKSAIAPAAAWANAVMIPPIDILLNTRQNFPALFDSNNRYNMQQN